MTLICLLLLCFLSGCTGERAGDFALPQPVSSLKLDYAAQLSADTYADGSTLVTIAGRDRYLLVPRGTEPDPALADGASVIACPVEHLYLAASSAMDLFRSLDALDAVAMTSTTPENWSIPEIREAVEQEEILYVGKYSAPDYEAVLDEGCDLCVESTMIYHTPEVKEQLERLGIPVLVERSSYESHPLGRLEWIRLYGLLTGREAEADALFREQAEQFERLSRNPDTGKKVAFFYFTPNGAVNVRRSGDYVVRLIQLAGGHYAFDGLTDESDNALSAQNLQLEAFYAAARDADVLIYNATVDGGVDSLPDLLAKNPILEEFAAVKGGTVWCTRQNLFQQPTAACALLEDFRTVLTGEGEDREELNFLYRLR